MRPLALYIFVLLKGVSIAAIVSAEEILAMPSKPTITHATAATSVATSSAAFQTVCEDLRAVTLVEADYAEEKTLHILSHPLHSKGTLMFSPHHGVYRVMLEPMHQELLITRSGLVQKDSQGLVQRMSLRAQPAAQAFVDVFLSFFAGDRGAWQKVFDVSFSGTVGDWKIGFSPRHRSPVSNALGGIVLKGREGILDGMTLTEANGDVTQTLYSNQRQYRGAAGEAASSRFPSDLKTP